MASSRAWEQSRRTSSVTTSGSQRGTSACRARRASSAGAASVAPAAAAARRRRGWRHQSAGPAPAARWRFEPPIATARPAAAASRAQRATTRPARYAPIAAPSPSGRNRLRRRARGIACTGTSRTCQPRAAAAMSTSVSSTKPPCRNSTSSNSVTGYARYPDCVSSSLRPLAQLTKNPATRIAFSRSGGSTPASASRLPTTIARGAPRAAPSTAVRSPGSCCPSPSSVTTTEARRLRAAATPVRIACPLPRRRGWRRTSAPAARAAAALPTAEPSSTTSTGACPRAAATTSPIVSVSLNTGTTTIGANAARPLLIVGGLIQVRSGSVPHLAFPSTAGREAATHCGWPDKGAAWLRTTIATWLPPRAIAWTSAGPLEEDEARAFGPRLTGRARLDEELRQERIDLVDAAGEHRLHAPGADRGDGAGDREFARDRRRVERERQPSGSHGDGCGRRHRVHDRVREEQRREAAGSAAQVAVDELDRRAQIAELGADHEPEAGTGVGAEPGVGERDPRRSDGELADARKPSRLPLVDESEQRRARDAERRSTARGQERPHLLTTARHRAGDDADARDDDARHR